MSNNRIGAVTVSIAFGFAALFLSLAPAQAKPSDCPTPAAVDGDACSGKLTSVTDDPTNFTITGRLVSGGNPVTLAGPAEAYLKSTGYAGSPPDPVQQWDATIDRVSNLDPADPNWYGNGKARAFLPEQLNMLASQFPSGTAMVRFVPDTAYSGGYRLLSIQPTG